MRVARTLFKAALRRAQRAVLVPPTGSVVLCYHLVGGGTGGEVDLPRRTFEAHLDWLADRTDVVGLADLHSEIRSRPRVVLTFDDAFANFADVVWPLLRARKLPATLFVPTGFVDGRSPSPLTGADLPPCSWASLRQMHAEGLTLGSHTDRHVDLRAVADSEIDADLALASRRIRDEVGVEPEDFCYPQAKWSRRAERVVARHHQRAVIGAGWHVRVNGSPLRIPRVPIRADLQDLGQVFRKGLWLEEWVANRLRHLRRPEVS